MNDPNINMPPPEMNENVNTPLMQQQVAPPPQQPPNYAINPQPQLTPNYAPLPQQQPQYGQPIASPVVAQTGMPTIVLNQQVPHTPVDPRLFKTNPLAIRCMFCQQPITTLVNKQFNCLACFLCFCTGIIFYVCIQACRRKDLCCYDAVHLCPNCGKTVGTYNTC